MPDFGPHGQQGQGECQPSQGKQADCGRSGTLAENSQDCLLARVYLPGHPTASAPTASASPSGPLNFPWSDHRPRPRHPRDLPVRRHPSLPNTRSAYTLAGQTIATRVSGDPTSANYGLFVLYTGHLGSTSLRIRSNNTIVSRRTARYLLFGAFRTTPAQTITDRGYTGHKHNLPGNGLGPIYMNASYYVPGLNRFASADTIVPDPAEPQA